MAAVGFLRSVVLQRAYACGLLSATGILCLVGVYRGCAGSWTAETQMAAAAALVRDGIARGSTARYTRVPTKRVVASPYIARKPCAQARARPADSSCLTMQNSTVSSQFVLLQKDNLVFEPSISATTDTQCPVLYNDR